jgi:hypothetical protein
MSLTLKSSSWQPRLLLHPHRELRNTVVTVETRWNCVLIIADILKWNNKENILDFESKNEKHGVFVVNYLGERLLRRIKWRCDITGVHFATKPKQHFLRHKKLNQNQINRRVMSLNLLPWHLGSNLLWLQGRCSRQLRRSCSSANMVYSGAESVFILEHYVASK